jgi:hypothetical protein
MEMGNIARACTLIAGAVLLGSPVWAGPEWLEGQLDAGGLPSTAQDTSGTGTLKKITGSVGGDLLAGFDLEDMYYIQITDPENFVATTTFNPEEPDNPGFSEFDTRLWLIDARNVEVLGLGLLANDSFFTALGGNVGSLGDSVLLPNATDRTRQSIPGPGLYLLAVSFDGRFCSSEGGPMFAFDDGPNEISGPDGAGGGLPITEWDSIIGLRSGAGGQYSIALFGAEFAVPNQIALSLDIRPGVCPNNFNVYFVPGVLKSSLLGTASFDVSTINQGSITISRADGVGGSVPANAGDFELIDNGTPFSGGPCECHALNGDGHIDLAMKFDKDAMIATLELDDAACGDVIELVVSGQLTNGTNFTSSDCIVIVD